MILKLKDQCLKVVVLVYHQNKIYHQIINLGQV
jgi:hypothetical protein